MKVTVKLTADAKPKTVDVANVVAFTLKHPEALVEVAGEWVPFEKKFAIVAL